MLGGLTHEGEVTQTIREDVVRESFTQTEALSEAHPALTDIFRSESFMKLAVSSKPSAAAFRRLRFACLLLTAYCLLACSVPNLETPACVESRDIVREFYSFHFGNGLAFSPESLRQRERFLTSGFSSRLATQPEGPDPFTTGTTDFPKAFRVGECNEKAPDKTVFEGLFLA